MNGFPSLRSLVGLAAATLLLAPAAFASPPECSCQHIEALQNDYINALYLADFQQKLGEYLKEIEDRLERIKAEDPTHPDASLDIGSTTGNARQNYVDGNLSLPRTVPGYTGPSEINMIYGTCRQHQAELDAMEAGSPCRAIADAALEHEAAHRARCEAMGAETYWNRKLSDIAFEEVEYYNAQAAKLKEELRRVLEFAEITYQSDWTIGVNAQGVATFGYAYSANSGDIGGATGGDVWTMTGKGESSIVMTRAVIAGMACTASGGLRTEFQVRMETDGLTFGLELDDLVTSGGMALNCPRGGGGGGPMSEAAGDVGEIASDLPLRAGANPLPGSMIEHLASVLAGSASVTGDGSATLMITCHGP